jgi:toxin ParE1/3/4
MRQSQSVRDSCNISSSHFQSDASKRADLVNDVLLMREGPTSKPPPRAVNLRPTSRYARSGPNTVCEAPYTRPALADLRAILDYIAAHSPQGARRVQARTKALTDLLAVAASSHWPPHIHRMTPPPYPYLVFCEATESEIIIHAVRHAARDPSGMPGSA